jgi:hypothetical protein
MLKIGGISRVSLKIRNVQRVVGDEAQPEFTSKFLISVSDPHGSALILVGWIWIRIWANMTFKKVEKREVLKGWMFSFEGWAFSCG